MSRLLDWLSEEAKGKRLFFYIGGCAIAYLLYATVLICVAKQLDAQIPNRSGQGTIPITTWYFLPWLIVSAFCEEVLFRLFPLVAADAWGKSKKIFIVVGLASCIFGLMHGGFFFIILQGVNGVLLSLLFLKCGGLQGKYGKALATTTVSHFLVNSTIAGMALITGIKNF